MRILFVNENIGGHVTVHRHLRRALAETEGVEASFVDIPTPAGLRRLAGARLPGLARLDLDLQPLRAQLAASKWLARRLAPMVAAADVVHLYTHNAGLLSARTWQSTPTVVSLDATNAQNGYRLPTRTPTRFTPLTVGATKRFEQRVYDAAATIVAHSEWVARSLRSDYRVDPSRVRVQPYGIIGPDFGPGPAPGIHQDRPRLVFVGRTLTRKGGRQLLDVHRRYFHSRAELVLVTQERVDVHDGVRVIHDIAPGDAALWDLLRSSAAFVFPSAIDMAPNAVVEAMTAGLPVVARPVGAIPEMVHHGINGLHVDGTDEELRKAIDRLLDDQALRCRMGAASRQWATDVYDARRVTDRLLEILADAIGIHASGLDR